MREFKSDFTTPIGTGLAGPFSGAVPTAELPPLPVASGTSGNNAVFTHPFQIVAGSTSGNVQVIADSKLFKFVATSETTQTITGLATNISISAGQAIFLHGTIVSGAITAAEITVGSDSATALAFSGTPSVQTDFWLRLGVAESGPVASPTTGIAASSSVWVRQRVFTHLRLTNYCTDGGPALYPVAA